MFVKFDNEEEKEDGKELYCKYYNKYMKIWPIWKNSIWPTQLTYKIMDEISFGDLEAFTSGKWHGAETTLKFVFTVRNTLESTNYH